MATWAQTGDTKPVAVTDEPSEAIQLGNGRAARIVNLGSVKVWIGRGATAEEAQANAVIPTAEAPTRAVVLLAGAVEVFGTPDAQWWSFVCNTDDETNVEITPGNGE